MNKWRQIKWSLHPLFVIILLLSALTGYFIELVTLFCIVLMHELGHVFMAHALGWKVSAVKLLPFGGVVEVEEAAGGSAYEEMLVAIAGPLQNVFMLLIAYCLREIDWWSDEWTGYFIVANLWILLFNLLPIMPLDGGKIVQALMSVSLSYYTTLLWSARISVVCSIGIIVYAVLPFILQAKGIRLNELMIGIFLFYSNLMMLRHLPFLFYRFLLKRYSSINENVKQKVFPILAPTHLSLYEAIKRYRRNRRNVLCVVDSLEQPYSLLPEQTVLLHYVKDFDVNRAVGDILS